jgi:hypothetical protein
MQTAPNNESELRFILTSTVGHECILSYADMTRLLNALQYQNKGLFGKIQPFAAQCTTVYNKQNRKCQNTK